MARILIFSTDGPQGRGVARLLRCDSHRPDVATAEAGARRAIHSRRPEMLVLWVPNPAPVLDFLDDALGPTWHKTPILAILSSDTPEESVRAPRPSLTDQMRTPFTREEFLARVDALLRVRRVLSGEQAGPAEFLPRRSPSRAMLARIPLLRLLVRERRERPSEPYLRTAVSLVGAVEDRDAFSPGHSERVSVHCSAIGSALALPENELDSLIRASLLHDIGKIALPAELLRKAALSEADRSLVRTHPRRGADLIRALTSDADVATAVLYHHERPDGQGYYRRAWQRVPLAARILSVAEVFDGMTSSRTGRPAIPPGQAIEALREGRGTAHDADSVEALAATLRGRRAGIRDDLP